LFFFVFEASVLATTADKLVPDPGFVFPKNLDVIIGPTAPLKAFLPSPIVYLFDIQNRTVLAGLQSLCFPLIFGSSI
jgi:hypothetical protein